jgi:chromosomal replication initiator protein
MAEREVRDLVRPQEPKHLRIDEVQIACARYYRVARNDIISARRTAAIVRPRQVGYYLSKSLTLKSLPEIGRRFGDRDHTSVLSGIRKITHLMKSDAQLAEDIKNITRLLGA